MGVILTLRKHFCYHFVSQRPQHGMRSDLEPKSQEKRWRAVSALKGQLLSLARNMAQGSPSQEEVSRPPYLSPPST